MASFYDTTVEAAVDAMTALLNGGTLQIYTGSAPASTTNAVSGLTGTLLATLTFGSTAFAAAAASGGTVTANANAITADSAAAASGTAGYFALVKSDGTTVVATGTIGTSGADLNLNSTAISQGATVSCSAFAITMPQT